MLQVAAMEWESTGVANNHTAGEVSPAIFYFSKFLEKQQSFVSKQTVVSDRTCSAIPLCRGFVSAEVR